MYLHVESYSLCFLHLISTHAQGSVVANKDIDQLIPITKEECEAAEYEGAGGVTVSVEREELKFEYTYIPYTITVELILSVALIKNNCLSP